MREFKTFVLQFAPLIAARKSELLAMDLEITIHDVEHGACSTIVTPNGQLILIDCGHNSSTGWRPSTFLRDYDLSLDLLIVSNLDEDHVSDLTNVHAVAKPRLFKTNAKIDPDWAIREKQKIGGPRPGVSQAIKYMRAYTGTPSEPTNWGMEIRYFGLSPNQFPDFNDLSLVTFMFLGSFGIVFPGDMRRRGWEALLKNPDFQECLARTTVFVGSHHGREDGYHEEVFEHCKPDLVLISDKNVIHGTQEGMVQTYRGHALGLTNKLTKEKRHVLTTRCDGTLTVEVNDLGAYTVSFE